MKLSRGTMIYAVFALIAAFAIVYYFNQQPEITDSLYHYNAAVRVAQGEGFVDDYLWVYIGAPQSLPAPSHLYWMPGTTLIATLGMFIFGANYAAAQIGLALCLWGASLLAYWLGWQLGGTARHAWQTGIIVVFGGFFMRVWGQTDTFAPYAFFGAMTLTFIGLGMKSTVKNIQWWLLAGIFAACSHLIRNDGLIMLLVGWSVLFFPFDFFNWTESSQRTRYIVSLQKRLVWFAIFTIAYLLAMSPWFIRNLNAIGTPLPVGGTQGAWFTQYNDLFNYPPDASAQTLFADGADVFIASRLSALFGVNGALLHFIGEQGIIVLTPFIFIGLWIKRQDIFIRPVWIFAIGIHLAFTLVFPFPGMNGGIWHASAALLPFWAILGLLGLDATIDWIARHRRTWNPRTAKPLFSGFIVLLIIFLSLQVALAGRIMRYTPQAYRILLDTIPDGAKVMINDPARLYYHTCTLGRCTGGVVIPNESPEIALEIAEKYDVDYLVLETGGIPEPMRFDTVPEFLTPIAVDLGGATLYAFERD
jgi:hypothetical protein